MKKQTLVERFQKLAGIEILNEVFNPFLDTEEGGYMREYIDDVVEDSQASDLINDGVVLYVSDDSKLAPKFIEPKKIGFIVYNTAIKDPSKSILSVTGTLSKNPEIVQIFNDNYGVIDINYITTFLTSPNNWKAITGEDELNNFMSKYNKIYLINHNGDSSKLMGEPESLDLEYRPDFDKAFDLALTKLKKDQPQLDFEAIKANKESFW
jgi:hypothetical protein